MQWIVHTVVIVVSESGNKKYINKQKVTKHVFVHVLIFVAVLVNCPYHF